MGGYLRFVGFLRTVWELLMTGGWLKGDSRIDERVISPLIFWLLVIGMCKPQSGSITFSDSLRSARWWLDDVAGLLQILAVQWRCLLHWASQRARTHKPGGLGFVVLAKKIHKEKRKGPMSEPFLVDFKCIAFCSLVLRVAWFTFRNQRFCRTNTWL